MNDGTKLLGLTVFLGVIGAFAVWNTLTHDAPAKAAERGDLAPLPEDWGAVWIGEPSGAAPLQGAERAGFRSIESSPTDSAGLRSSSALASADVFELRVQPGQVLSKICAAHYGTSDPQLVRRLAEYNGLANPDDLAVGALLRLPPADVLVAD